MLFYSPLSITPPESPSFSFSHQANYILVTIETCLLNAFCYTFLLSPFAFPRLFLLRSTCLPLCLLFSCTLVNWLVISLFYPHLISLFCYPRSYFNLFWWLIVAFVKKRWELSMSDRFSMQQSGLLLLPCSTCKQIKKASSLLRYLLSITIDCVSGPHWIRHSEMRAIWLRLLVLLIITDTVSNLFFFFLYWLFSCLFIPLSKLLSLSSPFSMFDKYRT